MNIQLEMTTRDTRATRWITHDHALLEMATAGDGFVGVIVNTAGSVYVIYPMGERAPKLLPITDGTCVSISGDGCFGAIGHRYGSISVWDLAQSQRLLECRHGADPVNSVSLSASGACLASASQEGLKTWDITDQIIEARKYATPEALRASIELYRTQRPSRFVFLTGPDVVQGSFEVEPPLLWAAECIGRELARNGLGLASAVLGAGSSVAIQSFLAEWERQGEDGQAALVLSVPYGRVPVSLPGSLNIEIAEAGSQHALPGIETQVVLGGNGRPDEMLVGASSEEHKKEVYRVPATRRAAVEVFGPSRPVNPREPWEIPIETREDAERMAAALCRRINGSDTQDLPRPEDPRQRGKHQLDRVLEALARDQPEEALQELTDPWLARLDRNEIEGVSIRAVQQYGRVYEHVRATQRPGVARTGVMGTMVAFVRKISMNLSFAPGRVIDLMRAKDAGSRIMGLAIAQGSPTLDYLDPAIYLIWDAISAFEQYHAMLVAAALLKYASLEQLVRLEGSLLGPKGIPMDSRDSSRTDLRAKMLREMDPSLASAPDYPFQDVEFSSSVQYEDDPAARHGPFVVTRGKHELKPIPGFQVGIYPVTNRLFHRFVRSDQNPRVRAQLLLIRRSKKVEPATWDSEKAYPVGTGDHPVSGIGYVEAVAFVDWVNANSPDSEWRWVLPTEDMWELAARSPRGLLYPWGNSFDKGKCNSAEVGINGPSEVGRFPEGQSWCGCSDMAGNVWEFVAQRPGSNTCVLRGGSYKNNQDEIKNCFRLQEVGVTLRAADFGFRCARVRNSSSISRDIPQAKVQAKENGLHEGRRSQGRTAKGTVKKAQKKKATPKLK